MKSTLERALELARDSSCRDINEIRRKLKSEGFVGAEQHTTGHSIKKQLNAAIKARIGTVVPSAEPAGASKP